MCSRTIPALGHIEIPALVAFHVLLCVRAGWDRKDSSVFPDGVQPSLPKGETKESLRLAAKRSMLPAVCLGCQRVVGMIEGGRIEMRCHKCSPEGNYNESPAWDISGALAYTLGPWASDAVVCAVLGTYLQNRIR